MDKRFMIIMGVIIVAFLGIFFIGNSKNESASNETIGSVSNHSIGNNTKNVELLVYGDFECSVCNRVFPIEKTIVEKYANEISFRFKHFPIDSAHPNARAASRAAEAAGAQGKFFEMHDLLYKDYTEWNSQTTKNPQPVFEKYAQQLGLDIAKFKIDYAAESTNSTINADKNAGNAIGVTGTPTYFINGQKVDNNSIFSVESFSKLIDEAIAKSQQN